MTSHHYKPIIKLSHKPHFLYFFKFWLWITTNYLFITHYTPIKENSIKKIQYYYFIIAKKTRDNTCIQIKTESLVSKTIRYTAKTLNTERQNSASSFHFSFHPTLKLSILKSFANLKNILLLLLFPQNSLDFMFLFSFSLPVLIL